MRKKYPIVLQEDNKDCGAACLSMIVKFYNGFVPYEQLKDQLGTSKEGISASKIVTEAKKYGFEAKGIEGEFQKLQEETIILPCIAHVLLNQMYYHYIVLYEMNVKKKYFIVGDPSKGIYKMSFQEFEKIWNRVILTFYPKIPIVHIETNNFLKTQIIELFEKEKNPFIIIIVLSVVITIFSILYSFMLEHFISMLDTHNEYLYLCCSILLYTTFILLKNVGSYFRNKLFVHVYQRFDFLFMKRIFHQILDLPYRYYKNRTTGEMIARIQDIAVIRSFLSTILLSSIIDFPLLIISAILLYLISEKLFLIAFISLAIYFVFLIIYGRMITKRVEQLEEENAKVTSYMVEAIGGYESIFGSHLKEQVENQFCDRYVNYVDCMKKIENIQNQSQVINQSILDFSNLLILSLGIWMVAKEETTIASLLLFHSLFMYFISPIRNLFSLSGQFKKVKVSFQRLSNLLIEQKQIGIYNQKITGQIEFRNLQFSYHNNYPVLKNLNFKIKAGSKVMIIGESGNGKSTILKLLMKYYEIPRNKVYIDDIDINDYKQETIDNNILYTSMREQLFTGPLITNILLDKEPNEQYQEIVKLTEVDEIIKNNSLGHHLVLEENGANLSGGEKQRVALARTLLLPFEILLLDEATSQMDVSMERRIVKRVFQKFKDKTIIMISHRVDNADLFDELIEMEHGTIKKDVKKNGTQTLESQTLDF